MAGINTTGQPNTRDYNLGRGKVYFARLDDNGLPQEYRDLGNAPALNITVDTTTLQHESSREGIKFTDMEVVIDQKIKVTVELDEINFQNLALYLSGDSQQVSNSAAVAGVAVSGSHKNLTVFALGCWYDLYVGLDGQPTSDPQGARIYDIGTLTVKSGDGMTTFVLGDDYLVDKPMGRIFILASGDMTADADDGVQYQVTMAANASAAPNVDEVIALTKPSLKGALKFIAVNPINAKQLTEYQFHQVSLQATGDFGMISDQVTSMKFEGTAEANIAASPSSPVLSVRTHVNAKG